MFPVFWEVLKMLKYGVLDSDIHPLFTASCFSQFSHPASALQLPKMVVFKSATILNVATFLCCCRHKIMILLSSELWNVESLLFWLSDSHLYILLPRLLVAFCLLSKLFQTAALIMWYPALSPCEGWQVHDSSATSSWPLRPLTSLAFAPTLFPSPCLALLLHFLLTPYPNCTFSGPLALAFFPSCTFAVPLVSVSLLYHLIPIRQLYLLS